MNDDLTPPPDQPLDDAARARMRERVVSGLDTGEARRRWLVPVAAAAAVMVLAGVTGYVALRPDDTTDSQLTPTGRGTGGPDTPSEPPSEPPADSPSELASEPPSSDDPLPDGSPEEDSSTCVQEVPGVLPGAEEIASTADPTGATTFYVAGNRYTLCDTHGGRATVHHPKPLAGGGDRNPYEISTVFDDDGRAVFAAAGPVPDGADDFGVSYRFADGHVEDAAIIGAGVDEADGGWWVMVYAAPDGDAASADPIVVDVRGADGSGPLDEPLDTCAQANHGC